MVDREKSFTLVCPKCGSRSLRGVSELPPLRVRAGVYRWPCDVCEYMVEMSPNGCVVKEPRRLTPKEKQVLKGKGKK